MDRATSLSCADRVPRRQLASMESARHLPFGAPLGAYDRQAHQLLEGHRAGAAEAIEIFHQSHPRFLDPVVTWLPRPISNDEIRDTVLTIDDARLAVARGYSFRDWAALTRYSPRPRPKARRFGPSNPPRRR